MSPETERLIGEIEKALVGINEPYGDVLRSEPDEREFYTRKCPHYEAVEDHAIEWLSALLSALRESEDEVVRLREAIRLDGEDAEFYFLSDPEGRLFVNLNDTFGYACADAEPIPWDEFDAVIAEWRRDARTLLVWAARKRGQDVAALASDGRVPKRTREALAGWLAERPRAAGREG